MLWHQWVTQWMRAKRGYLLDACEELLVIPLRGQQQQEDVVERIKSM